MRHTPCGCRSADLVGVQTNFRLLEHSSMRRAQQCRYFASSLPPSKRHSRLTTVRRGCCQVATRRDSWRSHVHRTRFRRLSSSSSPRLAMSGVEGGRPSSFSGGFKGGILFEKRMPPLVPRRARRSPSRASAGKRMQRCRAAIESPAPYRRKKGAALSGCINSPRPLGAKKAALARGNKKRSLFRGSFFSGISHYIQRSY